MPARRLLPAMLAVFAVFAASALARAQTPSDAWPDYRGPGRDGHSTAKGLPLAWSDTKNVKWKTAIHGRGWSSPVVWGRQVWLTTADNDGAERYIVCVDRETGAILLDEKVVTVPQRESISSVNSYASPSPAIDERRVYVHFGTYGTACYDTKTLKQIWARTDLHCDHAVGSGSSPVLDDGRLFVTLDGLEQQHTYALDAATGKTLWTVDRAPTFAKDVGPDARKSFGTPVLVPVGGKKLLVYSAAGGAYGYDAATGEEIWRVRHGGYSTASRAVWAKGIVYVGTGFDTAELIAIRMAGSGDITKTNVVWRYSSGMPHKPSPILVDGLLYVVNDAGGLTCLDAATGAVVWQERLGGNYSSSPIFADGRIYLFSERGKGLVLQPGRAYRLLAENELPDGCMASPAAVGRSLFVRTKTTLYRIEETP